VSVGNDLPILHPFIQVRAKSAGPPTQLKWPRGQSDSRRFLVTIVRLCTTTGRLDRCALALYDNRPVHSAVHQSCTGLAGLKDQRFDAAEGLRALVKAFPALQSHCAFSRKACRNSSKKIATTSRYLVKTMLY